jgi:hypothetical protein
VTWFEAARGEIRRDRRAGWKGLVIASCAALVAGLSVSNATAAGAPDAVVRVRVTDSTGAPLARTAVLTTVLWTSKADYERLGKPRGRLLRTDAFGELAVPIRLDRQQRASVGRNGDWANVSVVAFDAGGRPVAQATTSRYIGSRADEREQARSMIHAGVVQLVDRGRARASGSAGTEAIEAELVPCTYYWDADGYMDRYAQVGELHVDFDVTTARFTYGETADSTFDVVAKAGAADWSIIGSVHVANTLSAEVWANAGGKTNFHWKLRTQFRYVNMKLFKDCLGGPYRYPVGSQEVHALEWTGGGMTLSSTIPQPSRAAANTATYGPNTGWSRTSGTLVKWAGGGGAFGASIGVQSGASQHVKVEYQFGNRSTHYLYGDTGLPTVSKRVFQDTP